MTIRLWLAKPETVRTQDFSAPILSSISSNMDPKVRPVPALSIGSGGRFAIRNNRHLLGLPVEDVSKPQQSKFDIRADAAPLKFRPRDETRLNHEQAMTKKDTQSNEQNLQLKLDSKETGSRNLELELQAKKQAKLLESTEREIKPKSHRKETKSTREQPKSQAESLEATRENLMLFIGIDRRQRRLIKYYENKVNSYSSEYIRLLHMIEQLNVDKAEFTEKLGRARSRDVTQKRTIDKLTAESASHKKDLNIANNQAREQRRNIRELMDNIRNLKAELKKLKDIEAGQKLLEKTINKLDKKIISKRAEILEMQQKLNSFVEEKQKLKDTELERDFYKTAFAEWKEDSKLKGYEILMQQEQADMFQSSLERSESKKTNYRNRLRHSDAKLRVVQHAAQNEPEIYNQLWDRVRSTAIPIRKQSFGGGNMAAQGTKRAHHGTQGFVKNGKRRRLNPPPIPPIADVSAQHS